MQCLPRLLGSLDQLPAFVQRNRGGHFRKGVLAGLHRVDAHPRVPFPGRGDDDDVDVVAFEHPLVVLVAIAIGGRLLAAGLLHRLDGPLQRRLVVVGDGHDLDAFQRHHLGHVARAAGPQ